MKKLTLLLVATLMISGVALADGKCCKGGKHCCKGAKECSKDSKTASTASKDTKTTTTTTTAKPKS